MTDPVSGEMASQAVEQVRGQQEAVEEVDGADEATDFSQMMSSDDDAQVGVDNADEIDEVAGVDEIQQVDRVEEPAEIQTDDFVQKLLEEESSIEQMMEDCLDGDGLDQEEMLQMQAVIYSYSQRVDLTTKVVENATGGIEQVMNTQV